MKHTIKFVLIIICWLLTFSVNAQFRIGLKGGVDIMNFSGKQSYNQEVNITIENSTSYSFYWGLITQYHFNNPFFIQSELLIAKQSGMVPNVISSYSSPTNAIQVPVYVGYKFNIASDLDILLGLGPYVAYGAPGVNSLKKEVKGSDFFNFGLASMTGIQWNRIVLTIGYDLTLSRQVDEIERKMGIKHTTFKLSAGYLFK
jgi:hypothetical protein